MPDAPLQPSPWMLLPFALLLSAIALGPLRFGQWWLRHYPKVAGGLGAIAVGYYLFVMQAPQRVLHTAHDYVSFIALIGSLYTVAGGIHLGVKGESTPAGNVLFLLLGGLLANVIGTTGASMLLIRPWLALNRRRIAPHHIVFFIFIIANVGGGLTPIGDPPLFLGYLRGVPFWWVAQNCWPIWILAIGLLLALFHSIDHRHHLRVTAEPRVRQIEPPGQWRCEGPHNVLFLAVILGAVFIEKPLFLREGLMLAAALASYFTTRKSIHEANAFNFHPLREVIILFLGIFATMMPALDWLQMNAAKMGDTSPAFFYWATGTLSAALDNAPTYLCFLSVATGPSADIPALLLTPSFAADLAAISVGAVFFGAATYIGNGPNFMVKAIADQQGAKTPSFLGYFFRYTLPCLLPVLVAVWWIFFRR